MENVEFKTIGPVVEKIWGTVLVVSSCIFFFVV